MNPSISAKQGSCTWYQGTPSQYGTQRHANKSTPCQQAIRPDLVYSIRSLKYVQNQKAYSFVMRLTTSPAHGDVFCSTSVNGGSRTSILEVGVVYRGREQGVAGLVCPGELDTCRVCGTTTSDVYLEARNIRLRLSCAGVKGNCFGSDQVVSRCDVGRDLEIVSRGFSDLFER